MQILQNFKHNPKINTIFISKVCVACRLVVSPGNPRADFRVDYSCLWRECHVSAFIPLFPVSGGRGMLPIEQWKKRI